MIDPDKTQKIERIKRSIPREELFAREQAALRHFLAQAEIARERMREYEVAA
jgi:hypothetical protein